MLSYHVLSTFSAWQWMHRWNHQLASPLFLHWHDQFVSIALPVLYQLNFHMPLLAADCREAQYQGIFCNFQICTSSLEDCSAILLDSYCSVSVDLQRGTQACCPSSSTSHSVEWYIHKQSECPLLLQKCMHSLGRRLANLENPTFKSGCWFFQSL